MFIFFCLNVMCTILTGIFKCILGSGHVFHGEANQAAIGQRDFFAPDIEFIAAIGENLRAIGAFFQKDKFPSMVVNSAVLSGCGTRFNS